VHLEVVGEFRQRSAAVVLDEPQRIGGSEPPSGEYRLDRRGRCGSQTRAPDRQPLDALLQITQRLTEKKETRTIPPMALRAVTRDDLPPSLLAVAAKAPLPSKALTPAIPATYA
jgi:hypothetical protein